MSTEAQLQIVTKYPPNTFCWVDLSSTDQEASKQFYAGLFGWSFDDVPLGDGQFYTNFTLHGHNVAGCGPMQPEQRAQGMPSYWASQIAVENADAVVEKAEAAGGVIFAPAFDVFDAGRMAVIQDPTGGIFGIWQPINHIGANLVNIPDTWVWNELMTRDTETAARFYAEVFGWTSHSEENPDDDNPYVMFMNGERSAAGMMRITEQMPDMPANWSVYFNVENFEAGLEKAKALGGEPLTDPIDTGAGRLVPIRDPQGAVFNLIQAVYVDAPPQG